MRPLAWCRARVMAPPRRGREDFRRGSMREHIRMGIVMTPPRVGTAPQPAHAAPGQQVGAAGTTDGRGPKRRRYLRRGQFGPHVQSFHAHALGIGARISCVPPRPHRATVTAFSRLPRRPAPPFSFPSGSFCETHLSHSSAAPALALFSGGVRDDQLPQQARLPVHEDPYSGLLHAVRRASLRAMPTSAAHSSGARVLTMRGPREMTEIGATPFIHVARDSLLWQLSALRDQSGKALELLMDTVLHNDPTDQDIQNAVVRAGPVPPFAAPRAPPTPPLPARRKRSRGRASRSRTRSGWSRCEPCHTHHRHRQQQPASHARTLPFPRRPAAAQRRLRVGEPDGPQHLPLSGAPRRHHARRCQGSRGQVRGRTLPELGCAPPRASPPPAVARNLCGPNMLVAGVGVDPKPFTAACSDLLQGLPAEDRRPGLGAFDSSCVAPLHRPRRPM